MKNKFNVPILVYSMTILIGICLIVFSAIFLKNKDSIFYSVFISIGCGLIPSGITGIFIEYAKAKELKKDIEKIRKTVICCYEEGVIFIIKYIIEKFPPPITLDGNPLTEVLKWSIGSMKIYDFESHNEIVNANFRERTIHFISYGFELGLKSLSYFEQNEGLFAMKGVFSDEEILNIKNIRNCYNDVITASSVNDAAEYLELFIDSALKTFPQIVEKLNHLYYIENNKIKTY